jgi:16S rRNA (cytidine1402-2'-O)-methyltransferase
MPAFSTESREAGSIVGNSRGRLDVVATPIGNLGDLSARAQEVLAGADVVAAEDTRHTGTLLKAIGVSRPLVSLHAHNESNRVPELLARLAAGENIALVSDAGTPLLSDPGYELVSEAARAGCEVRAIPGPSAIAAALTVAGLPTDRFCFEGFLPSRSSERRTRLEAVAADPRTLVFFEAPHRIEECLADLAALFGEERLAAVARELTKAHETTYRGTLAQLIEVAKADSNFARGEITVVVQGAKEPEGKAEALQLERVVSLLVKELPPSRAAALAAQLTGARRNEAYALAMRLAKSDASP